MKWYLMESVYWNSWNMEWIMIFIPDVQYLKWLLSYVTVHYGRKASVQFISLPFITSILVSFKDFIKGSPEGSSDPEFLSSILYNRIIISGWLISRSTPNWLKMTSFNFRVGLCRIRLSPRLISKEKWTPLWTTNNSESIN